ncbi:MAG: DinB family protein, partial [Siphonobacter aquaeclarae]|nr:DinB family protein [Siphonobacter aquaeclarae]
FDENAYMEAADFSAVPLEDLLAYYRATRAASLVLFRMLTDKELSRVGSANGSALSARAFIYILSGHEKHHLAIMAERYQFS